MRTTIDLDEALINEARRLTGLRSKRVTVDAALREFVTRLCQQSILGLIGQGPLVDGHDVRAVRAGMPDHTAPEPDHGRG
jgi:Arc/MetJ family transcription regulator